MSRQRVLLTVALSTACCWAASSRAAVPTDFVDEIVLSGLSQPLSMAFLPDGRLLFTERTTAKVRMVVNGHIAAVDPAVVVPNVTSPDLERGLQGIAVDPRWPAFPYLYVCYTRTGFVMELTRYTGSGDLNNPNGENLTFGSPLVMINDFQDTADNHNGLGLRFGTDGNLLMTTGDDADHCSSQDPSTLRGALLRLDVSRLPAGAGGPVPRALLIPPDNPLSGPDSNRRLVYAYGLRNPWRFHVDPSTGAILLADVGEGSYEELDEVFAGDNFGWPYREGILTLSRPECGPEAGPYDPPILPLARATGYSVITTAGLYRPVSTGTANWPPLYWGNLFYSDFSNGRLRRLIRSGGSWVAPAAVPGQPNPDDWGTGFPECSDFMVGPDGSLYWFQMFAGLLRRVRYTGPTVSVPPGVNARRGLAGAPNPFRGRVELSWRLAVSAPVTIEIFDPTGRRVRRLHDDTGGVEGRATWDGKDEHGVRLPSGLYLARLAGERDLKPTRLLLLD